ncbi:MAG: hypothetical protein ABJA02_07680 [Acidobacteriota bacterium]
MHCPSCGQQQVSNETKFCSRCGLPLGLVSEVLAHGGFLPQLAELNKKKKPLLTRRNGLAFSLIWCLFFLFIMTPLWGILDIDKLSGASAIIGIFGGLIMLVSTLIFLKKDFVRFDYDQQPQMYQPAQNKYDLRGQASQSALPPQQTMPAGFYTAPQNGSWRETNDLQPSVTESTTRLLNEDDKR